LQRGGGVRVGLGQQYDQMRPMAGTSGIFQIDVADNPVGVGRQVDMAKPGRSGAHRRERFLQVEIGSIAARHRELHRQISWRPSRNRSGQRGIARFVTRFEQQHIECHRARFRFGQRGEQTRLGRARPRPRADFAKAAVIDRDQHDPLAWHVWQLTLRKIVQQQVEAVGEISGDTGNHQPADQQQDNPPFKCKTVGATDWRDHLPTWILCAGLHVAMALPFTINSEQTRHE